MENRIDLKIENHIAHAHLIRGDKMNALDAEMMEALIECGERIKADKSIRAVVLSGEGRLLCRSGYGQFCPKWLKAAMPA